MKLFSYLIVAMFFLSFSLCAAEINGEMLPNSPALLKEGDVVNATIRIWPVESVEQFQQYEWEGKTYLNSFLLFQLSSVEPSENNADVLEIKGLFVVKNSEVQSSQSLTVGPDTANILWKGPVVGKVTQRNKDFYIENQSVFNRSNIWMLAISALLFLILIFFTVKFIRTKKLRKVAMEYTPERFDEIFRAASTREEFERIYALKSVWIPFLKIQTSSHVDFFKTMNQHQYKKSWGVDEITEAKSSFENIRRSFSV